MYRFAPGKSAVALYIDKSGRLAATMKVYSYLCSDAPYKKDEWTEGRVYEINENLGVFVAVADRYFGLFRTVSYMENAVWARF